MFSIFVLMKSDKGKGVSSLLVFQGSAICALLIIDTVLSLPIGILSLRFTLQSTNVICLQIYEIKNDNIF